MWKGRESTLDCCRTGTCARDLGAPTLSARACQHAAFALGALLCPPQALPPSHLTLHSALPVNRPPASCVLPSQTPRLPGELRFHGEARLEQQTYPRLILVLLIDLQHPQKAAASKRLAGACWSGKSRLLTTSMAGLLSKTDRAACSRSRRRSISELM